MATGHPASGARLPPSKAAVALRGLATFPSFPTLVSSVSVFPARGSGPRVATVSLPPREPATQGPSESGCSVERRVPWGRGCCLLQAQDPRVRPAAGVGVVKAEASPYRRVSDLSRSLSTGRASPAGSVCCSFLGFSGTFLQNHAYLHQDPLPGQSGQAPALWSARPPAPWMVSRTLPWATAGHRTRSSPQAPEDDSPPSCHCVP